MKELRRSIPLTGSSWQENIQAGKVAIDVGGKAGIRMHWWSEKYVEVLKEALDLVRRLLQFVERYLQGVEYVARLVIYWSQLINQHA